MNPWMRAGLTSLLCAACVLPAAADQPFATFASFNDWVGAETRGVRVGADGRLRLAPSLKHVAQLPEGVVWAAVPDGEGGAYLSAGNEGKLFRYSGGQVKPLAQVKGGIVFAMARVGKDLVAAPSGEGKLVRVTPLGEVKPFADIDARLVWAMAVQGSDLVLAGGQREGGRPAAGQGREQPEARGTLRRGRLHGPGPGSPGGLVRGLPRARPRAAPGGRADGDPRRHGFRADPGHRRPRGRPLCRGRQRAGRPVRRGRPGERGRTIFPNPGAKTKGALIRLDRNRVPTTLWQSAQSQVFALAQWGGQILVGTGNRARIFAVPTEEKKRSLDPFASVQDAGTAQATAFLPLGADLLVVGSNPAELHVLSESQATEGYLESRILKGAPLADWGRAYVDAETPSGTSVDLQYRAGATELPDGTWTPWSPPLRNGERPNLPPTRFAQFRLKLGSSRGGATPVVDSVRVHWANRNLAPVWESIDVLPTGLVLARSSGGDDAGIERVPLDVQKLIPALSAPGPEKRGFRRGAQAFAFKVSDPNGDQLQFRITLVPEKGSAILLEKTWRERFFTVDTLPVPDGKYRLEVIASDAPSQPFNLAQTGLWRTAAFTVDHTPPVISELTAQPEGDSVRVRFAAHDETSPLKEAAVSADGDEWLQVAPDERVFDSKDERFDVLIPRERIRGDRVMVKVMDICGNEQSAAVLLGEVKKH